MDAASKGTECDKISVQLIVAAIGYSLAGILRVLMKLEDLSRPRRLAVILGAGASHDCVQPGKNEVRAQYRPPMVEQLFDPRPGSFNPILNNYPKARALSSFILSKVGQGVSLEAILRDLESDPNVHVKRQYWQVPLYLQELLGEVSVHYVVSGGTKFDELVFQIERSKYDELLYVTLNYDLFMERALENLYGVVFNNLNAYVQKKWSFVKLHGSVNWGQRILNDDQRQGHVLPFLDSLDSNLELHDEIVLLPRYQIRERTDGHLYYPALAVPVEGKRLFSCHLSLVDRTQTFFSSCQDFLFIGFSARDVHVLQLLTRIQKVRKFAVVNGGEKPAQIALQFIVLANHEFHLSTSPWVTHMGFREFVASGELEKFLSS